MMVEPYAAGLALRDVQNHTFHELFMDGEWRIVDPYADNRLRNKKGESATFDDIQNYLTGKPDALQLPEVPQPRTTAYLSRFKKENYKRIRHNFGSNLAMKMLPYSFGLGIPANAAVKLLRQKRLLNNTQISMAYLTYVRNNIRATILSSSDPKGKAAEIQDWFLQNIMLEKPYTISTPPEVDEQYTARQKQLFGRTREALKLFGKLPQNEDILFYEAQCYFRLNDIKKFNSLAETLDKNRFYSAMYYRLNGKFFKKKGSSE